MQAAMQSEDPYPVQAVGMLRLADVPGTSATLSMTVLFYRLAGGIMLFSRRYSTICP
jgi:hypothetical protein